MTWSGKTSTWIYRVRRIAATLCIGVLAVLIGYKAVVGANGAVQWRAKRAEYKHLQQEIEKAKLEHEELENRVRKLQTDPNTIVKEAREKLGYVMPGEVVLVQPQPKFDVRPIPAVAQNLSAPDPKKP
jgi:cell division protein FtsB